MVIDIVNTSASLSQILIMRIIIIIDDHLLFIFLYVYVYAYIYIEHEGEENYILVGFML